MTIGYSDPYAIVQYCHNIREALESRQQDTKMPVFLPLKFFGLIVSSGGPRSAEAVAEAAESSSPMVIARPSPVNRKM